jgi:hypothetical protein
MGLVDIVGDLIEDYETKNTLPLRPLAWRL